jgi:hypothetical protein
MKKGSGYQTEADSSNFGPPVTVPDLSQCKHKASQSQSVCKCVVSLQKISMTWQVVNFPKIQQVNQEPLIKHLRLRGNSHGRSRSEVEGEKRFHTRREHEEL